MKGTKLYSIFTSTCPVCHIGKMYTNSNPYNIPKTLDMHERCSHCNTKYKMEPFFFYGAMYVSYGVGVAIATITFVLVYLGLQFSIFASFMSLIATLVLLFPITARISRNIWINMFLKYDKEKAKVSEND
ncbi:MAG: hypothetical protein ACI825_001524 [Planctomycetota bacterium]|jgi:uncharacterized protein (DUF983 family)|uniref:DUF983 domain-containing protein n=1 Tax=Patiriisocius sp. Uisw_047 TaxID=3230969 RepID=UPI0039ED6DED